MRLRLWSRLAIRYLREPPIAVGTGPHVPAGLGGDDHLVAVALEVLRQDQPEVLLGRAVGRAVVVGEVEMGDAAVEGPADDGAAGLEHVGAAEVLPQAERNRRQLQAGAPDATIFAAVVTSHDRQRT